MQGRHRGTFICDAEKTVNYKGYIRRLLFQNRSTIVGVTTLGVGCDSKVPGVFAKITQEAKDWIKSVATGTQDNDCDQKKKSGWRPVRMDKSNEENDEGGWRPVPASPRRAESHLLRLLEQLSQDPESGAVTGAQTI